MSDIIASVSGVRGIVGDNLTPRNISKFTSAFAEYCRERFKSKKVVVGRDGRLHGDMISNLVINNLLLSGFEVVDIGVAPTPTIQIATEELKAAGGISVTASHNPQVWNGLKFLNPDGTFLDEIQVKDLLSIAEKGKFHYEGVEKMRSVIYDKSWLEKHIAKVLESGLVNLKKIRKRNFKVVVDAVNSSGSIIVPLLLKKLGCEVIELFCDGSGKFPHKPEPIPENLKQLSKAVKKNNADLGISVDPDTDRLVLITEEGKPFGEEYTITTVVKNILKNSDSRRKNVTVNLSTTRAVDDVAGLFGGRVYRSPVGEINVVKEMKKNKSLVGGEGSGGVIIPDIHFGRDALVGIAIVLQEFADYDYKVSDYKNDLPKYFITKTKIQYSGKPETILNKVINKYSGKDCKITTSDGIKLDFKEHWIHLRKSNTEPIIRIITEAKSKKLADDIQKEFLKEIR
ncbi:MAG: phosphoglucosamine mutase [Ignavibacteria bacterium]|nr:phosphoglucosamine mutase [Ignavibacteria bacterium]